MSDRKNIKTTIAQAVDYWSKRIDECGMSVDWAEAHTHCWRCGCERNLERCHIIPDSLGGEDTPRNIVLLCKRCHADGPNVMDPEIMWDWIRAYSVPLYGTFWSVLGMKEYQFIYKTSYAKDLADILAAAKLEVNDHIMEEIKDIINVEMSKAGIHFGHPYLNTATMAGINRMVLKKIAQKYNVEFPIKREEQPTATPWWIQC